MANPNLIFKVPVTVSPIDRSTTEYDSDTREPILTTARETAVVIDAQVQWTIKDRSSGAQAGREQQSSGYLVVLKRDLVSKGWTPTEGDKITSIPETSGGPWYVSAFEPCMHKRGQPRGLIVYFQDRMPAKKG